MSNVKSLQLNDGNSIPQLGFGTYQIDPSDTADMVGKALEIGYRHIDTAQMYQNEAGVGEAIKASGLDRSEIFVTSKLNNGHHKPDDARSAFEGTLAALDVDYIDLFLIHWPLPTLYDGDFVATWKVLEEFKAQGKAKSIGVSNFQVEHLEKLLAETDVVPAVNQIESHPYFQNKTVAQFGEDNDILTEAWSPIGQGGDILEDDAVAAVANEIGKSPAQTILRWHVQHGRIVFPKSSSPDRIAENFAIFDFELSAEQMHALDALDKGAAARMGPDPDTFDMIPS